jgi:proteic killer suppression protein
VYDEAVIKSFRHKGLDRFFHTKSKSGIQPSHAKKLAVHLGVLDQALEVEEMDLPGWRLHSLQGELAGHWAVSVNGNWRMTFRFEDHNAYVVDYQDYH